VRRPAAPLDGALSTSAEVTGSSMPPPTDRCFRSADQEAVQGSAPEFGPALAPFDADLNRIGCVVWPTTRFYKPKSRRLAQRMRGAPAAHGHLACRAYLPW
jgi:hypothetical protein